MAEKDALGMFMDFIGKTDPMSADEEMYHMARFKLEGKPADRDRLIVSNLKFAFE